MTTRTQRTGYLPPVTVSLSEYGGTYTVAINGKNFQARLSATEAREIARTMLLCAAKLDGNPPGI